MELKDFWFALRRSWPLLIAGLVIGLVSAALYSHYTVLNQASASVAVLDPLSARPNGYAQAQVTFDQVVESQALASAVAAKVGETPDRVHSSLSVTVASPLTTTNSTSVTSPVYVVHASDRSMDRAILLANTAVDEARARYAELNSSNSSAVLKALSGPQNDAETEVKNAQAAFDQFVETNNAADLPTQIGTEQSLVSWLQQQLYGAQSAAAGSSAASATASVQQAQDAMTSFINANNAQELPTQIGGEQARVAALNASLTQAQAQLSAAPAADQAQDTAQVNSLQESVSTEQGKLSHLQALLPQYDQLTSAVQSAQAAQASAASQAASSGQSAGSLSQNLATEQAKLDHLKSLLPKYDELSTNLQSAQALSNGLSNQMQTMQLAQVLPASSETKLVDPARPDSQAVNSLLGYGLGIVSGLILGLAAVYVAGLVRPRPITPEELAEVLEAPLLVRLPARVRRG